MECPYPGYEYVNINGERALRQVLEKPGQKGTDRPKRGAVEPAPWSGVPFPAATDGATSQSWSSEQEGKIGYKPDMGKVQQLTPREDLFKRRQDLLDCMELSTGLSLILVASFLSLFALSHMK